MKPNLKICKKCLGKEYLSVEGVSIKEVRTYLPDAFICKVGESGWWFKNSVPAKCPYYLEHVIDETD
jgi:hypothetical protein